MFITKRQQEALLALAAMGGYYFSKREGCWYNFVMDYGYFASRTMNILIDAGWVGRGIIPDGDKATDFQRRYRDADPKDSYAGEEVVALTPEGRKLARLLSARSK